MSGLSLRLCSRIGIAAVVLYPHGDPRVSRLPGMCCQVYRVRITHLGVSFRLRIFFDCDILPVFFGCDGVGIFRIAWCCVEAGLETSQSLLGVARFDVTSARC